MKVTIVSENLKIEYSDEKTTSETPVNQYNTVIETQYNVESIIKIIDSLGSVAKMLGTPQNLSTDGTVQE